MLADLYDWPAALFSVPPPLFSSHFTALIFIIHLLGSEPYCWFFQNWIHGYL